MTLNWTEKYRPETLEDIVGNTKAINDLKRWANNWKKGRPRKQHAVILAGDAGIGKTSAALALGKDMGWTIIELNASDARNYEKIKKVVTMGVMHETFSENGNYEQVVSGGRKLIIIDEADNLYERRSKGDKKKKSGKPDMSDRGGKKAIIQALSRANQPIVLIVNDIYALTKGRGIAIKKACKTIKFNPIDKASIKSTLKKIVLKEGIKTEEKVLTVIADKADGDLRSAVNDLQTLAIGRKEITQKDINVIGYRDPRTKIFGAMRTVFKTRSLTMARDAVRNLDEVPENVLLWLDENLPREYMNHNDLIRGYHYLSRADIMLNRVYRRQYFGLWAYASELMSGGVAMAKSNINRSRVRYNFPSYLIRMSRSKKDRGTRNKVMSKFRTYFHCSTEGARETMLTLRQLIKRDKRIGIRLIDKMKLDEGELSYILNNEELAVRLIDKSESLDQLDEEERRTYLDEYGEEETDDIETPEKDSEAADDNSEEEDEDKEKQSSLMDF